MTLIQAGAAPHRALRYHLTKGARTRSELVCSIDIKSDEQSGPMPTLVVGFETVVADVLADGTAKLRLTVVETRVRDRPGSPVTGDLVRSQAAALRGVVITETLAPDGKLAEAQVEAAAGLSDKVRAQLENLTRSLQQVAMRMPAEPVGVGATWRERRTLPEGGIRAVSETTYTLTSFTDHVIEYTSAATSSGAPQTVEQDGVTAEVTSTRGSAEAEGSVDLSRYALAVSSTSTLTTVMNVVAPEGTPGAGPSTIEITMAIQVTATDAASGGAPSGEAAPESAVPTASSDAAPSAAGESPGQPAQGAHKAP